MKKLLIGLLLAQLGTMAFADTIVTEQVIGKASRKLFDQFLSILSKDTFFVVHQ
ncbi:MAG: hypothetical protein LEGION0403_FIIPPAGN_00106 [Legionella sp.]|uniref:hypothetical protein n=1 Tax=Legionella sp. TaxID=459 RepID=UPI003D0F6155